MNPADLILGILIAVLLAGAVILAVRRHRKGSPCCGNCGACGLCKTDHEKTEHKKKSSDGGT